MPLNDSDSFRRKHAEHVVNSYKEWQDEYKELKNEWRRGTNSWSNEQKRDHLERMKAVNEEELAGRERARELWGRNADVGHDERIVNMLRENARLEAAIARTNKGHGVHYGSNDVPFQQEIYFNDEEQDNFTLSSGYGSTEDLPDNGYDSAVYSDHDGGLLEDQASAEDVDHANYQHRQESVQPDTNGLDLYEESAIPYGGGCYEEAENYLNKFNDEIVDGDADYQGNEGNCGEGAIGRDDCDYGGVEHSNGGGYIEFDDGQEGSYGAADIDFGDYGCDYDYGQDDCF